GDSPILSSAFFITATQVKAADPRSFRVRGDIHGLLATIDIILELELQFGMFAQQLLEQTLAESRPVVYRGWRKHVILWDWKLQSLGRKVRKMLQWRYVRQSFTSGRLAGCMRAQFPFAYKFHPHPHFQVKVLQQ